MDETPRPLPPVVISRHVTEVCDQAHIRKRLTQFVIRLRSSADCPGGTASKPRQLSRSNKMKYSSLRRIAFVLSILLITASVAYAEKPEMAKTQVNVSPSEAYI